MKLRCKILMSSPSTWFVISEHLQPLAFRNVRSYDKGRIVSDGWRSWQRSEKTRSSKTSNLSSLIGFTFWMGHWAWGKLLYNWHSKIIWVFTTGEDSWAQDFSPLQYIKIEFDHNGRIISQTHYASTFYPWYYTFWFLSLWLIEEQAHFTNSLLRSMSFRNCGGSSRHSCNWEIASVFFNWIERLK
jgi:hypothetical protein